MNLKKEDNILWLIAGLNVVTHLYVHKCNEVKDNIGQNATGLLAGCDYGVNETTCFGLLGVHHQVYKC